MPTIRDMASNKISDEESKAINDPDYLYKCTKCGEVKPNKEFACHRKATGRGRKYTTRCKACARAYDKITNKEEKNRKSIQYRRKHRLYNVFSASKGNARKKEIEHNLTQSFINKLWERQKGLCYYTGKPMDLDISDGRDNSNSISIDRVDSSRGYIIGNVVLCRWVVNRIKNNLSIEQLLEVLEDIKSTIRCPQLEIL